MSEYRIYSAYREFRISSESWRDAASPGMAFVRLDTLDLIPKVFDFFTTTPELDGVCAMCEDVEGALQELSGYLRSVTACGGLVENEVGELLFIRRHGVVDLPKGKLEAGETLENAALREVGEETGCHSLALQGKVCETWHCYGQEGAHWLKRTHWYAMRTEAETVVHPQQEEGITDAFWVSKTEAQALVQSSYPTIREVLRCYLDRG